MEIWLIWVILIAVMIIIELLTQWISTFCLAIGCIGGLLSSLCGVSPFMQVVVTGIVTVLAFFVFMPYFKRKIQRRDSKGPQTATGMDALIGRTGTVVEDIVPGQKGRVKIDGDNWQAVSDTPFFIGDTVRVLSYDSIILHVTTPKH